MTAKDLKTLFSPEAMNEIFPEDPSDHFFEALYGDASEGAYQIGLRFKEQTKDTLFFAFHLTRRPVKCLRCSLTYGLPRVFARHPVIDLPGVIRKIDARLDGQVEIKDWRLGRTEEISEDLHAIPLMIAIV